jgi:hypothetical protein
MIASVSKLRPAIAAAALAFVCLSARAPAASAQRLSDDLWVTDAPVLALARSESTLYVGGSFRAVGPNTGGGVPLGIRSARALPGLAKVAGIVYAAAADGDGGWYVGGSFVGVGGLARSNLAHILANGQVAAWHPDPDGPVYALALTDDRLYVGGSFTTLAGARRSCLAALSRQDETLLDWDPHPAGTDGSADLAVRAVLPRGEQVYVGGHFLTIGGAERTHLAAIDAQSGRASAWDGQANYTVRVLAERGGILYVGGDFHLIGGAARRLLAAVDIHTARALPWGPDITGSGVEYDLPAYVDALDLSGSSLYFAGHFAHVAGHERGGVAEVDLLSGALTPWNPSPVFVGSQAPYIWALVVRGPRVYVGGRFHSFGGTDRLNVAAVDRRSGAALSWDPGTTGDVHTLTTQGEVVFAGGEFGSAGGVQTRLGLAALDAHSGALRPWNPGMLGFVVQALAVRGQTVYVGGIFDRIGGEWRTNIGAVSAMTGHATEWDPQALGGFNGGVNAIVVGDRTVYVGGGFTVVGGAERHFLAALDSASGTATDWNPGPDDFVNALASDGTTIYVGGSFASIAGQHRTALAAVDLETGLATGWNPDGSGVVIALALRSGTLYVGGGFESMGGAMRHSLAALDVSSGIALPWNPDPRGATPSPEVQALAPFGTDFLIGGRFTSVAGQPRTNLAAVETGSDMVTAWRGDTDGWVWAMMEYDGTVYVGGSFSRIGLMSRGNLAAIESSAAQPKAAALAAADRGPATADWVAPLPQPLRSRGILRFALAAPATVSLTIFDLQGRRVAALLDREPQSAGQHEVSIYAAGWNPGCYLCRLEVGGLTATRKMIVVK